MRMSLFHGQSMFMGEMTDFFHFLFLFLFLKRKAFITQLSPTFLSIFFVRPSNQLIFIALPVPLQSENPGSRLVLFFLLSPPFFLFFFFCKD